MDVSIVETSGLGDRSYLVSAGGVAVVIDPQRDIDRLLNAVAERQSRVTHVLETHVHNDYVSGGLELARVTGAEYVVPAGEYVAFERRAIADGDVIDAGPFRLRAIHTPGHTHHHTSYALSDAAGTVLAVFTGGSMLYGSAGRTDLLGDEHTEDLTHAQYHSVRRLADQLPAEAAVYPTHGFGSFCAATPASGDASTIGQQRQDNPALTQDEQTYVEELLAGLSAYPAYYAHMGVINRCGPDPVDLSVPTPVDPVELRRRIDAGEWIVDLRHRTAFAAGHLSGALGFELSDSFVTHLGWLHAWGAPLTLIGDDDDQIAEARRELVRIGVDGVTGAATEPVETLAAGHELRAYRVADFGELADVLDDDSTVVLDVRRPDEHRDRHIRGAVNIPVHELLERIGEVPTGEIWVHCASGYRASVAASLLDRERRTVVLVDDDFDEAAEVLPTN
ncbi:MBL fold metallo-hydrolase [Mycolicibacterium sp. 050158]|uniref:MBL fold metallo-hydrolase n=1 Tax=Mycolicibacterium sp. 050158 TaxID=3090602 RepID=UPI00299F32A6|nr:MBL fold metallo-hydrolase [Mycolicibacterium sp. 050158]MDX1891139.1 MBL fold metallo-hydrolase [Mycolicibacterium sp. 050158]